MRIQSYSGAESSSNSSSSSQSVRTLLTKPCTFELSMLYYNKLLLHKIDKIKMAGTSREISSVMTSAANNYNTSLDSSVRITTRIRTEVTLNRIRANAHNSGNHETRDNARRTDRASDSSRLCLRYVSTTHRLYLDYALASISCEHCLLSRNNPHCAPGHVIYYYNFYFIHSTLLIMS